MAGGNCEYLCMSETIWRNVGSESTLFQWLHSDHSHCDCLFSLFRVFYLTLNKSTGSVVPSMNSPPGYYRRSVELCVCYLLLWFLGNQITLLTTNNLLLQYFHASYKKRKETLFMSDFISAIHTVFALCRRTTNVIHSLLQSLSNATQCDDDGKICVFMVCLLLSLLFVAHTRQRLMWLSVDAANSCSAVGAACTRHAPPATQRSVFRFCCFAEPWQQNFSDVTHRMKKKQATTTKTIVWFVLFEKYEALPTHHLHKMLAAPAAVAAGSGSVLVLSLRKAINCGSSITVYFLFYLFPLL